MHIRIVLLITLLVSVLGDDPNGPKSGPADNAQLGGQALGRVDERILSCVPPTLPFQNEAEAEGYVDYLVKACWYNYWRSGQNYRGVNGFRAMFGSEGDHYDESTVFNLDGRQITGYKEYRKKAVVTRNLISFDRIPSNIVITDLSADGLAVSFDWEVEVTSQVGGFGTQQLVSSYSIEYFDNGVVKKSTASSTGSIMGNLVNVIVDATAGIADSLGYFDDSAPEAYKPNEFDDLTSYKYITNPIRFIFVALFCTLSILVAICVYFVIRCLISGDVMNQTKKIMM